MASTTIGGVEQWPTTERFASVTRTLNDARNELERLEFDFRQLNNEYDPPAIAQESVPVTAEAIAAAVEFLMETEITVEDIAELHKTIAGWPGLMAHVRVEQNLQRRDDAS
jgi:hypothetical protein